MSQRPKPTFKKSKSKCKYTKKLKNLEPGSQECEPKFIDKFVKQLRGVEGCSEKKLRKRWNKVCKAAPVVENLSENMGETSDTLNRNSAIVDMLAAFGFDIKEGTTLVDIVKEKFIYGQIRTIQSAIDTLSGIIESQAKRFIRVVKLLSRLGAAMTDSSGGVLHTVSTKALETAEKLIGVISDKTGWVVQTVCLVGIVIYMSNACFGFMDVDTWENSFKDAIDWMTGIFSRVLPSPVMAIVNFMFSGQLMPIRNAYLMLSSHISRISSLCSMGSATQGMGPTLPEDSKSSQDQPSDRSNFGSVAESFTQLFDAGQYIVKPSSPLTVSDIDSRIKDNIMSSFAV